MSNSIVVKSNREHILSRPNMYFGRFDEISETRTLYDLENNKIITKKVKFSPAILKLFDEAITNATDNINRSKSNPTTRIEISITDEYIQISNNGESIPIRQVLNPIDNKQWYEPELAFGHAYSSSNYNDEKERMLNGMNGIGIKLANIFSKKFVVTVINNGKYYRQIFSENMSKRTKPIIKDSDKPDSVTVYFEPDFEKLKCSDGKIGDDLKMVLFKRTLDSTLFSVQVVLNNRRLPQFSFFKYFEVTFGNAYPTNYLTRSTPSYDIILFPFKGGKIVSFVNKIITTGNGNHVKFVIDKIIERLALKNMIYTKSQIEGNICLYLNINVDKPTFTSQSKDVFEGKVDIDIDYLVNALCSSTDFLMLLENKKISSENRKLKKIKPVFEKLTEANLAGTIESSKCTLFVTEGDSATGMVQQCFSSLGHDYFGIYTLGGKPLNIRKEKSVEKWFANRVIRELITTLGIELDTDYSIAQNRKKLRYGKLVCVKDADVDGSAIMMLVCNIIHVIAPTLLQSNNFFYEFITPQIKLIYDIHPGKQVKIFYVEEVNSKLVKRTKTIDSQKKAITTFNNKAEFIKFMDTNRSNINVKDIKYYKGLAAISTEDALDYWEDYSEYLIPFVFDEQADMTLYNLFDGSQECIDWRKKLTQYTQEETYCIRIKSGTDITQYGYFDYGPYAREDCMRSIPNVYDGLKPVQRKILYSLLIHRPKSEQFKKVFQIATQASLDGNYHHGDASINEATCGMMQTYMGSNNLTLVAGSGQIGSRFAHGQDHGATRYIEGALSPISKDLFPKIDDQLLERTLEDEILVEPKYYIPILPLVLINGCEGIGTGYSTFIPNHSYEDCERNIREVLNLCTIDEPNVKLLLDSHNLNIRPCYPGFKGTIELDASKNAYSTYGVSKFINVETVKKNRNDSFWKTTKLYNSEYPELNYEHAFIEITEIPIDSKLSMNNIITALKDVVVQIQNINVGTTKKTTKKSTKKKVVKKAVSKEQSEEIKCSSNIFNKDNIELFVDYQDNSYPGNEIQDEKISLILKIKNNGSLEINDPPEIIRLSSSLSMRNMMLYSQTENGLMLKKFDCIKDIFDEFFTVRYQYYVLRKKKLIFLKEEEIKYLKNKIRYCKEIGIDKTLDLNKFVDDELEKHLINSGYDMKNNSYEYLYSTRSTTWTITGYKRLQDELSKKEKELDEIKNTLVKTLWERDLDAFNVQKAKFDKELSDKRSKRLTKKSKK